MNEEDSEQMALHLADLGYVPASGPLEADVVILNTCSVRQKPEDKAFSMLGELGIRKKLRPGMIVGVCGCMAQARADEIRRRAPHVDFVLGTGDLGELPGLVLSALADRRFRKMTALPERKGKVVTEIPQRHLGRTAKLKAHVPIQYGCDKFCTYCIVPQTRGRERSRPSDQIVEEVRVLAAGGTREISLLGQTVNSYGKNLLEGDVPFSELLRRCAAVPGVERLRYTSPYPRDFRDDLVAVIRDVPEVMEHVHLPLQSGDDEILREMRRVYTVESFMEIVGRLRAAVPEIGLTTDVIVGFPGETEAQFERTVEAFRAIRFDNAYMFAYSTRPGTPAGDREDQVPQAEKMRRLNHLIGVQNAISAERNAEQIGREVEVLVEGPSEKDPSMMRGYTRDWRMAHFPLPVSRVGRTARLVVTGSRRWGLLCEPFSEPAELDRVAPSPSPVPV